jgi:hypothetical protein
LDDIPNREQVKANTELGQVPLSRVQQKHHRQIEEEVEEAADIWKMSLMRPMKNTTWSLVASQKNES